MEAAFALMDGVGCSWKDDDEGVVELARCAS
jgi:hypothetical protein